MTKSEILLKSSDTVFNMQNLAVLWSEKSSVKLKEVVRYYVRTGRLFRIQNGIFSKTKQYSNFELAQKLVPISYISGVTALNFHGFSYQYYDFIECVGLSSKKIKVQNQLYLYHKLNPEIIFNNIGLEQKTGFTIASKERAVCEVLLFYPGIGIEKIEELDKVKLIEISKIYTNKKLIEKINKLCSIG